MNKRLWRVALAAKRLIEQNDLCDGDDWTCECDACIVATLWCDIEDRARGFTPQEPVGRVPKWVVAKLDPWWQRGPTP